MYFTKIIDGIDSWEAIYQNTEAFEPLVRELFKRHQLPFFSLQNLRPGSNAVFRVDDLVIKLFGPTEAGFQNTNAFEIEKTALAQANSVILSPKLVASGVIQDAYQFNYIIMEQVEGVDLFDIPLEQRITYIPLIKKLTTSLNQPLRTVGIPIVTMEDCLANHRWQYFSDSFQEERRQLLKSLSFENPVYVHGDFKVANLILNSHQQLYVVDFADSHLAPVAYEWPYMVFGLFGCHPQLMYNYFGDYQNEAFIIELSHQILIHKFGAFLLMEICELKDKNIKTMTSIQQLYQFIQECLESENCLIE
ncbi:aminoglycoside phosphotransferase family protein [uncultured Vagococcus sp.]|uniref:aminoglycoside phosphotransferase family protein n=1 Tax=uncultured Vagococcus sp. TaxID=189676 RepID=UPI0028D6EC38|nr:aminoglycoside phosphotransferase family protein [uncultured Vagococcus sp.]